jgi:hypothetical protein
MPGDNPKGKLLQQIVEQSACKEQKLERATYPKMPVIMHPAALESAVAMTKHTHEQAIKSAEMEQQQQYVAVAYQHPWAECRFWPVPGD